MNSNSKRSAKVNKILRSHHIETEFQLCNFFPPHATLSRLFLQLLSGKTGAQKDEKEEAILSHQIIIDLDDKRKEGKEGGRKERKEGRKEGMGWCGGGESGGNDWFTAC